MANEGLSFDITADLRPLETALKKAEQSIGGLTSKLEKGFSLFDARIGVLKKGLVALDAQARKSGELLSASFEVLGSISGIPLLGRFGEEIEKLSGDTRQLEANFKRLFAMKPGALLSEIGDLETQIQIIGAAVEAGIPARAISDDVRLLKEERKQVFDALVEQASEPFNKLENLASFDGAIPDTFQARKLAERLEEFRGIFQEIRSITDDPGVRTRIDMLPFFEGPRQRERGALEPRSPRDIQLATFEATEGVNTLAAAQSMLTDAVERSGRSLEEQTGTIRNLDGAARDLGFTFASSFEDAVVEGRRLSDVLQGLEQDILRILTRKLVTEPLAGAATSLIGTGVGALAGRFHGGGRVGSTAVSSRVVPASLFAGAPRFAGGGMVGRVPSLAPGEVPAILHRGEVVRTPAQEAALRRNAGGSGDTRIVVNIQTPDPRAFNESRGQIQAMLADAVRAGRRNR